MDDGWDDDDDLGFDDNKEELPQQEATTSKSNVVASGGWDDDDDFDFDDDDEEEEDNNDKNSKNDALASNANNEDTLKEEKPQQEGWDDEDDHLNFDDDDWDDDDNPNENNNNIEIQQQQQQRHNPGKVPLHHPTANNEAVNSKKEKLLFDLDAYVKSLQNNMVSSMNAILESENYNTPEKARELIEYYSSRPGLAEYTREKELSRMEYGVVLPHGDVETDPVQIANLLKDDNNILARCANQSLLADIMAVLTGVDRVVRPHYMASCVADRCQFTIVLEEESVTVRTELHLSLPTCGEAFKIASIRASIVFCPAQTRIEFRIHDIQLDPNLTHISQLQPTVEFLADMNMMDEDAMAPPPNTAEVDYRDQFLLQTTQKMLHQSTAGMKSAMQQMESIVNFKSKLQMIGSILPDTSADVIAAAEEETMEFVREQQKQQQLPAVQQERRGPSPSNAALFPRPPPPPQVESHSSSAARPSSILGGLVSSGLNVLAKTVTLPEDDPNIYGVASNSAMATQQQQPQPTLKFYRKTKDEGANKKHSNKSVVPQLYRRQEETDDDDDSACTQKTANTTGNNNEERHKRNTSDDLDTHQSNDGWDDDDDLLLEEEEEKVVFRNTTTNNNGVQSQHNDATTPPVTAGNEEETIVFGPYDPEDDIIPTRKRWINPTQHRRPFFAMQQS